MANFIVTPTFSTGGPQGPGMIAPVVEVHTATAAYAAADIVKFKFPLMTGLGIQTIFVNIASSVAMGKWLPVTKQVITAGTTSTEVALTLGTAVALNAKIGVMACYGVN